MAPTLVNPARAPSIRTSTPSVSSSVQPSVSRRTVPTRVPAQRTSVDISPSPKLNNAQYVTEEQQCRLVTAPESPPALQQDCDVEAAASSQIVGEEVAGCSTSAQLAKLQAVTSPAESLPSCSSSAQGTVSLPPLSIAASTSDADALSVVASTSNMCGRDHNSVTIKANTNVKDAAGAVVKVLSRIPNVLVTALRLETAHDSLNRAVKSIAVARKYINDESAGNELTFLPFNRSNNDGVQDPNLFAFLCFKTQLDKGMKLLEQDQTDLNVSRGSNSNTMANAIIRIIKERGQAVMKAGGSDAIFIAMSAMVNARRRLKRNHNMDAMIVPAWITEDTSHTLGRESKFLRFNILPCPVNGPLDSMPLCA